MTEPAHRGADAGPVRAFRRNVGVRLRLTLAASAVVAVALAVSGIALVTLLGRSLDRSADATATQRGREIVALMRQEGPDAAGQSVAASVGETTIAQILGPGRQVLASSAQIEGEPAIAHRDAAPGTEAHDRLDDLPVGDGAAYSVVSLGVRLSGVDYQVMVAQSLAAAQSSVRTVSALLLVGLPILALLVGAVTFALVGRSLWPVESMRRQVSAITARDLSTRVPVPSAQDELSRLAQTMNDMLDRLEQSQATARRFVADASHELRSPVSALKAILHVTGSGTAGSDWPESRAAMGAEADRLERIVAELLFLAAADDRGVRPVKKDVDLDDLVAAERQRLRAGTSLTIGGHVGAVRCTGDRHQLSQALRNLADNAAAHARHRVDVSLGRQGASAVIEVSDDGPGVPEADRARIFDRFVRLDASRTRVSGGTGLGLAIVAEVVRAHGGTVHVVDGLIGGATFRLELPLGAS
ncbi:MAG: hypothetical protein QOE40_526 [Actinomycetota bacterium]|nr:hypothetical protein [Actinomycetota bacterium]